MQLYNTLTRKKEPFIPVHAGKVGIYACGITTYDYCHIGHARSAVVFDVLVRYLRHMGLDVTFVRNFTDVDDKIIARAIRDGAKDQDIAAQCRAISEKFIQAFHEDMDTLGVIRADIEPKATEHIQEMLTLCEALIAKGDAYATLSGDVYFRVRSFPQYGKLSGRNIDEMRSGARVAPGEEKEDPLDFALWKSAKPGEPSWSSPWGQGRPGWHIECSAMTEKHLTLPLDIHGGGQDLIFPHHENELAQTEAATGKEFAKYWVHNGFVQMDSEKMSKSLGNFKTIRDILAVHLPEVLRFFLLSRQYRSPIDFTPHAMEEAEKNCKRIYETLEALLQEVAKKPPTGGGFPTSLKLELDNCKKAWDTAMDDDLNTAAAIGHLHNLISLANKILDEKQLRNTAEGRSALEEILATIHTWGNVLGVFLQTPNEFLKNLTACKAKRKGIDTELVDSLIEKRLHARKSKDFATSDAVRDQLTAMGIEVRDTPQGAVWDVI